MTRSADLIEALNHVTDAQDMLLAQRPEQARQSLGHALVILRTRIEQERRADALRAALDGEDNG